MYLFVVPGNGQASLGMHDIYLLNIIKVDLHSIGREHIGDLDNHCMNRPRVQREDTMQEKDRAEKCYTKMDSSSKSNN